MTIPPFSSSSSPPESPPDLDAPLYGATARQAAVRFWRKYVTFHGRASPSEFWWWTLLAVLVSIPLQLIAAALSGNGFGDYFRNGRGLSLHAWLPWLWALVTLVPTVALVVRRLHDTNRSGWWYLLALPSLLGAVAQVLALRRIGSPAAVSPEDTGRALAALIPGLAFALAGLVGSAVLFAFLVSGPDPRGVRFDRRPPG